MRKKSLFLAVLTLLVLPACAPAGSTATPAIPGQSTAPVYASPTADVVRPEGNPLAGTSWYLVSYGPAASPMPAAAYDTIPTNLDLHASGKFNASMGCNDIEGEYSVRDDKIIFEETWYTLMGCEGLKGIQEKMFGQVFRLKDVETFTLDGNMLTVTSSDGSNVLIFRAFGS